MVEFCASQSDLPHNRAKPTEPFRSMSTGQRTEAGLIAEAPQPVAGAQEKGIYPARSHGRNFCSALVLVGCVSRNAAPQRSGLLCARRCELLTVTEQPQAQIPPMHCKVGTSTVMQPGVLRQECQYISRVYVDNSRDNVIFFFADIMFFMRWTLRHIERRR